MIRKLILLLSLVLVPQVIAQEMSKNQLDSLYNLFTFVKGVNPLDKLQTQLTQNPEITKCGLNLVNTIKQNLNEFSPQQQNILSNILDRPTDLPNEAVTSNNFFRIHYTTTGTDAIGYDLNLLLAALDSVYNFEINFLGYFPPPSDGTVGGDDKYDVYIQNLNGLYGYTQFENKIAASQWTSYMVIDNDFLGYYSTGINGARVTVAHEFHHGIQSGSYAPEYDTSPFRSGDVFFYEITSTAMEEFVFSSVNDYYAYMSSYFRNPATPMPLNDGYNLAIWNIYLEKRFGFNILKHQWELIPANDALKAIALSINQNSSTFGNELNKFGIWTYFANSNAIPGRYFDEAANYPLITPTANVNFTPPLKNYDMSVKPTANLFLKIILPSPDGEFISIITNSDWQKAIDNPNQFLDFSFSVYNDSVTGEKNISENYSISFSRDNQTFWNNAGILDNLVVYGDSSFNVPDIEAETFAYPLPFNKSKSNNINIVFQSNSILGEEVDLNIYSAGMDLVFADKKNIRSTYLRDSKKYCEIMINKSDVNFSTGVYIYAIKSGDDIFTGKLVIFND